MLFSNMRRGHTDLYIDCSIDSWLNLVKHDAPSSMWLEKITQAQSNALQNLLYQVNESSDSHILHYHLTMLY